MKNLCFFDNASTTRCCEAAQAKLIQFSCQDYGNPSSSHHLGQKAYQAIEDARAYFASLFDVEPDQVIFTGSGSEANNLAIQGVVTAKLCCKPPQNPKILTSPIEHPAVLQAARSLKDLQVDHEFVPVELDSSHENVKIRESEFLEMLTPQTAMVSIMTVNNITGAILPVQEIAKKVKAKNPNIIFHTDAVQALGKTELPTSNSAVDLVSVSAHKIHGPKGVGALIILNRDLLKNKCIRPLIWGGGQEQGLRSGTQNTGLISAFHVAAQQAIQNKEASFTKVQELHDEFYQMLKEKNLLEDEITWNSPKNSIPHIVSLSIPGLPAGPIARLLEERKCLVSTGSACSSRKADPDYVLKALGLPNQIGNSAIRVSFSNENTLEEVHILADAIEESIQLSKKLLSGT